MTGAHKRLIERLTARGFALEHIPGVVRNVLHLIGDGGVFTIEMVNQQPASVAVRIAFDVRV